MNGYLYQQEGYDLMAAAFEVYNQLGSGFLEEVYHECLEIELAQRDMLFVSKKSLVIFYKNNVLKKQYEPDLIISNNIIVELKAVKATLPEHEAQLFNYLKATGKEVGYLINFGSFPHLEWKRIILTKHHTNR